MSVSLYYSARRAQPLTGTESTAVEHLLATRARSFPYADEEGLYLYDGDEGEGTGADENDEILAGSTKLPTDPDRWIPVIAHVLDSVTELRRAVGEAQWHVHLDDVDVPWDEGEGYVLSGG
ncbi:MULTISPECIES: hypothetical protein [unclassified Streptomyces]|uniref:hypothetical protein n=1 Tax=unclassified Streptomyces TaxID=2593676 RepID=UPI00081BB108|nr:MULTISPECIES: hypothetical protein [unclassified Streptomyces]MYQ83666.1 hypothetical protein [Streptomyces sp. SID4936]SCD71007.1 hypothetical protein GA0115234_1042114 [Streptomyces sp. DvalAA-43]